MASTSSRDGKTYVLRTCSKPEDHIHPPDKVTIFKDRIMVDIKTITRILPTTAMGKANYGKLSNNNKTHSDIHNFILLILTYVNKLHLFKIQPSIFKGKSVPSSSKLFLKLTKNLWNQDSA